MSDAFRRVLDKKAGPGGVKCPCCGTGESKRVTRRHVRRKLRRETVKEVEREDE